LAAWLAAAPPPAAGPGPSHPPPPGFGFWALGPVGTWDPAPAGGAPRPQHGTRPHLAPQGWAGLISQAWPGGSGAQPLAGARAPLALAPPGPSPPIPHGSWMNAMASGQATIHWLSRKGPFAGAHYALESAPDQLGRRTPCRDSVPRAAGKPKTGFEFRAPPVPVPVPGGVGVDGASCLRNSRIPLSAGRRACKPAAKPAIPRVILVHYGEGSF
jgi:hypothetical protein